MIATIIAIAGGVIVPFLVGLVALFRAKAQVAKADAEIHKARADGLAAQVKEVVGAAHDEKARAEEETNAHRKVLEEITATTEEMALRHPDVARDYVKRMLEASTGLSASRPSPPVSPGPAAGAPRGGK